MRVSFHADRQVGEGASADLTRHPLASAGYDTHIVALLRYVGGEVEDKICGRLLDRDYYRYLQPAPRIYVLIILPLLAQW